MGVKMNPIDDYLNKIQNEDAMRSVARGTGRLAGKTIRGAAVVAGKVAVGTAKAAGSVAAGFGRGFFKMKKKKFKQAQLKAKLKQAKG